ncbi:MAG: hypothetical protein UR26_C0003G0004 [candidate division TM6 bacterium GW2011_GWF2_32_72]|nr:MAG: hypothetical protein UR26_C0003G0004 [candidate division TM6 bacterium GW2011_GWF2_32_72]
MNVFYVLIFLQVLLESFPISSSGHLKLFDFFCLNFKKLNISDLLPKDFDHFLHGPTILVLVLFFYKRCVFMVLNIFKLYKILFKMLVLLFIADAVTAFFYLFRDFAIFKLPLWCGFLITALLLFSLKFCNPKQLKIFNVSKAVYLGLAQAVALLLPGVSRFGITYVVARWLSLPAKKSFELSFAIEMPLITAGFLKGLVYLLKSDSIFILFDPIFWFVTLFASVFSYFGFWFMYWLALQKKFWLVSIYMIIPIVISLIF